MKTKLLVFTDLHVDIMPDAVARMGIILKTAKENNVDFLLHLGDIMYPEVEFLSHFAPDSITKRLEYAWFVCDRDDEKTAIRKMIMNTGIPLYGVLGNHDMDSCSKQTACLYWNMPSPYYSFTNGGVRFIVLDANYIQTETGLIDFDHCNYRQFHSRETCFLPKPQLDWLENEIHSSTEPCVLLSHAPIGDELLNIHNMQDVWAIIKKANQFDRKVILALNGHNHVDGLSVRMGVPFLSINSAANIYLGAAYKTVRYSETICKTYPHLSSCAPYYDPLYAIISIDDYNINVTGIQSSFVGQTPQELSFPEDASYFEPCAAIRSRVLPISFLEGNGRLY